MRIFGIQTKIILPMAALFIGAFITIGYISTLTVGGMVEERYEIKATSLNRVLSRMGYPMNDEMMKKIRSVLNADIAAVNTDKQIIFSTIKSFKGRKITLNNWPSTSTQTTWGKDTIDNHAYALVCVRVPEPKQKTSSLEIDVSKTPLPESDITIPKVAYLILLAPESEIADAKKRAVEPIIKFAVIGLICTLVLGFIIARTITKPLRTLAAASAEIARGGDHHALQVRSHDEVRDLARAMSNMLDALKSAEEKLIRTEKMAAIGQVSAGLAHEIRNPLSSMKMNVQLLRKQVTGSEVANEAIDHILNEIERLDITISELLSLTQRGQLQLASVDVHKLFDETISLLARQIEHADVTVKKNYNAVEPTIIADAGKLRQIFLNVLLNALQAMPQGGVITVSTTLEMNKQALDTLLIVSVTDEGAGIASENSEKIFQMLYTTKPGGSGMGLSIAREIAEEHGGTLELGTSEKGAKLVMTIPVSRLDKERKQNEQNPDS